MGYKSVVRSAVSSYNKSVREKERQQRIEARELERLQKKVNNAYEKLKKICNALEDEYAKGKIGKKEYKELKNRESEITIDLVVVGKSPFISLAKRYITGKIDSKEFEEIQKDILPTELLEERQLINEGYEEALNKLKEFRNSCKDTAEDECQKCNSKKTFFSGLKVLDSLRLCKKCRAELLKLQFYEFSGDYFVVDTKQLSFSDVDDKIKLAVNLRQELFFN
jgi:hypothetical protein